MKQRLTFLAFCLAAAVVAWKPLATTFSLAWTDERYTHILLILPVIAALTYLEWPWPESFSFANLRLAAPLIIVSLSLAALTIFRFASSPADDRIALSMLALVTFWIGAFVLCFSRSAARKLLFPLAFLYWLVPFPDFLLNWIIINLQLWSAFVAKVLFNIVGTPVSQDGILLYIPGLTIEVAQECSSIRSSLMLLVTTMVLTQLILRSPWRKAIVIAAVIPLAVAKNGLRIFTIASLGTRVDPGYLTGRLHHQGGIVFFLIALGGIALLLWALRRGERSAISS